jgi:hypothetical protein
MQFTKVLGLAAVAAACVLASIGAGTASGASELVLCEELVASPSTFCPKGKILPGGTEVLGLASHPKIEGTITVECEDSIATAKSTSSVGEPLEFEVTKIEFGSLPTPSLGAGCSGCTNGVHTFPVYLGTLKMENEKDYAAHTKGSALLLGCPFGVECKFGSEELTLLLDPDAAQHDATSQVKGDQLLIGNTLIRVGGSILCGSSLKWTTAYTTLGCHKPGVGKVNCWLALFEETPEEHELVLCKQLAAKGQVCPPGEYYPSGTKLLALAGSTEFKASPFSAVKCEDSQIEAETTAVMGKTLGLKITKLEFGKLPTPKLGEGCTTCTEGVHTPISISGAVEVAGGDDLILNSSGAVELLNCFGLGVTCVYGSEGLKSLIDNDEGKHKLAAEEKGLAQILVAATLEYIKGSNFCPEKGTWTATYVVYAVESSGKAAQGWLALYRQL